MTYPCPHCGTPASEESGCPSCGRPADPDAIEVIRADAEISELKQRIDNTRQVLAGLEATFTQVWLRRQAAASRVQAKLTAQPVPPQKPEKTEVGSKFVQNALFLLGGLLLGVAAIVFTAVAWAQFGVGGRAVVLGAFTVAALAVPFVALRRNLTATAETFAAVGLLLILLDGYAAWYVNLFGVADGSGWGYAGAVFAVTAAVAAGYEHVTGLAGPRFAALIIAQPVIPLLVAAAQPGANGWAFTFAGVVALNVVVLSLRRGGIGIVASVAGGLAALTATGFALGGLFLTGDPGDAAYAGIGLIVTAAVVLAGAFVSKLRIAREITGGLLVAAVAVAFGRVTVLLWPGQPLPKVAAVVLAVAVVARFAGRGARIGALVVVAAPALYAAGWTMTEAGRTLFVAHFAEIFDRAGWELPIALALFGAALTVLLPGAVRWSAALVTAALIALTGLHLTWWYAPVLDLAVVAAALALLVRAVRGTTVTSVIVAVSLGVHAVAVGLARPGVAAAVFAAVAVLGCVTARLSRGQLRTASLLIGLLAVPAAAWSGTEALTPNELIQMFAVLAVSAVILVTTRSIAAHAGAVLALVLVIDSAERSAIVFALWGLVLGVRARHKGYLLAAATAEVTAGLLILAANGVTTLEAYTVPAAAVALLAGLLFGRGVSSWAAYGPALAAALLPSLASVLAADGQHLRRLLLGAACVAVVAAGALARLRAPVLLGGGVLVVLALHELAQLWDLIPRWIPLAAAGLALVLIATTLERRRRDLHRFRTAIQRMS
ncbi:zinc ribbon domain-containing protein [Actinoplanes bogorensis]|uniref:Zinc ribbon domain-containing protein n=1 Tax=Paractinoplanes bogorensis TaxID=1610840 RepID=A0ABS5YRD0_9ACTN|nr:zinc ribbon domain-containing protein [Actinoplanes bogorensis]MBU2666012.1 zinc ribbon domain-containing protein [Actinoplanes bogorensis]